MKTEAKERCVNLKISSEAHAAFNYLCLVRSQTQVRIFENLVIEAYEREATHVRK